MLLGNGSAISLRKKGRRYVQLLRTTLCFTALDRSSDRRCLSTTRVKDNLQKISQTPSARSSTLVMTELTRAQFRSCRVDLIWAAPEYCRSAARNANFS